MQKFYLKIEKEKWTAIGGPGGRRIVNEEGNRGRLPDSLLDVQMINEWAAEHIPEGLRRRWPTWNWNTNGPEDGLEMWRVIVRRDEKKKKKKKEHV